MKTIMEDLKAKPLAEKVSVDVLGWMAGDWECEVWGGTFQERWSEPAGNSMIGSGRHLVKGETSFMEFMSVEPNAEGQLVMWMLLGSPSKGPKTGVPFTLTRLSEDEALFENTENEFPSKIMYRRFDVALFCVIEGEKDGKLEQAQFNFLPIE